MGASVSNPRRSAEPCFGLKSHSRLSKPQDESGLTPLKNRWLSKPPRADLPESPPEAILCPMKLRLDLLEHLTAEDIRKAAEDSVHRYKPGPNFSKTGTGSLSSASTKERAKELEHSMELTRKLEA